MAAVFVLLAAVAGIASVGYTRQAAARKGRGRREQGQRRGRPRPRGGARDPSAVVRRQRQPHATGLGRRPGGAAPRVADRDRDRSRPRLRVVLLAAARPPRAGRLDRSPGRSPVRGLVARWSAGGDGELGWHVADLGRDRPRDPRTRGPSEPGQFGRLVARRHAAGDRGLGWHGADLGRRRRPRAESPRRPYRPGLVGGLVARRQPTGDRGPGRDGTRLGRQRPRGARPQGARGRRRLYGLVRGREVAGDRGRRWQGADLGCGRGPTAVPPRGTYRLGSIRWAGPRMAGDWRRRAAMAR